MPVRRLAGCVEDNPVRVNVQHSYVCLARVHADGRTVSLMYLLHLAQSRRVCIGFTLRIARPDSFRLVALVAGYCWWSGLRGKDYLLCPGDSHCLC